LKPQTKKTCHFPGEKMDRTKDFQRLAGVSSAATFGPPEGGFMRLAEVQQRKLEELKIVAARDGAEPSDIHAVQDAVAGLEQKVEDLSDLARAPRQTRDQVASRRGVISALYEDLHTLAAKVQGEQVSELQREAEVASYFTATPASGSRPAKLKPPPGPGMDDLMGWSEGSSQAARTALNEESLRAEEQSLLATFTTDLDKIQETRAKIEEVSAMVGLFATKVTEQTEQIDENLDLIEQSTDLVENAEKHLNKAIENSTSYRFYVVVWFIGSALFLLIFDFIDARWSPI